MWSALAFILILLAVSMLFVLLTVWWIDRKKPSKTVISQTPESIKVDTTNLASRNELLALDNKIRDLPGKLLESIQGSISHNKGKLSELIAYFQLRGGYDKVIPLGGIVDYIGIKFPTATDQGTFDFIDIKNAGARLSSDQKKLQELINNNRIKFLKIRIDTEEVTHAIQSDNTSDTSSTV